MKVPKAFFASLLAVMIILMCFFAAFLMPSPVNSVENKPWLNGWDHRKSHAIEGSQGAGTDYQIKIVAHYPKGTDLGQDVYLNMECQKNFNDIRFTDSDGESLLDFWLETQSDANYAVFWVKINANLDQNQTIYIYYGNPGITSASSMEKTFPFADDFQGNSLNSSNWQTFGRGTATINNGKCTLESVAGERGSIYLYGKSSFGTNYSLRFRSMVIEQGHYRWTHHGFATIYNDSEQSWGRIDEFPNYISASQESMFYAWTLRSTSYANTSRIDLSNQAPATGVFYTYEIQRDGAIMLTRNDALQGKIDENVPTEKMGVMLAADNGDSTLYSVTLVDWVVIRKYIANEPLQGIWGPQENIL